MTVCYGLTKEMDQLGLKVTFCLPKVVESQNAIHVNLLSSDPLAFSAVVNDDWLLCEPHPAIIYEALSGKLADAALEIVYH